MTVDMFTFSQKWKCPLQSTVELFAMNVAIRSVSKFHSQSNWKLPTFNYKWFCNSRRLALWNGSSTSNKRAHIHSRLEASIKSKTKQMCGVAVEILPLSCGNKQHATYKATNNKHTKHGGDNRQALTSATRRGTEVFLPLEVGTSNLIWRGRLGEARKQRKERRQSKRERRGHRNHSARSREFFCATIPTHQPRSAIHPTRSARMPPGQQNSARQQKKQFGQKSKQFIS